VKPFHLILSGDALDTISRAYNGRAPLTIVTSTGEHVAFLAIRELFVSMSTVEDSPRVELDVQQILPFSPPFQALP
jgi:hypothetical protein